MNLHEVPVFQRSGSRPIQFLPCAESTHALSDFLIMIVSWLVKQSLRAFLFQEVQP